MIAARGLGLGLAAFLATAPAIAREKAVQHATGRFEVKLTPEAQVPAPEGGMATGRMGIAKTFAGGMTGTATGTMLTAGAPGDAMAYVAIDQFRGEVNGKAGGGELSVAIAPDTGTGALAGIEGTLSIDIRDGAHFYDLAYTLPK